MTLVSIIGAGPGDPELLTRKAWRILGQADVVLHDALIDAAGMKAAAPQAKWVDVGKRSGIISAEQAFISRQLVSYAKKGLQVVRLKGGDPSIFGRLTEEIEACHAAGLRVEIIPGVTAACAAAAQVQTSLTSRDVSRSVAFVTPRVGKHAMNHDSGWLAVSLAAHTVVLYMASAQSRAIGQQLIEGGKAANTPVCVVESASLGGVSIRCTLRDLAETALPAVPGPVLLMVGEAFAQAHTQHHAHRQAKGHDTLYDARATGSA